MKTYKSAIQIGIMFLLLLTGFQLSAQKGVKKLNFVQLKKAYINGHRAVDVDHFSVSRDGKIRPKDGYNMFFDPKSECVFIVIEGLLDGLLDNKNPFGPGGLNVVPNGNPMPSGGGTGDNGGKGGDDDDDRKYPPGHVPISPGTTMKCFGCSDCNVTSKKDDGPGGNGGTQHSCMSNSCPESNGCDSGTTTWPEAVEYCMTTAREVLRPGI